jgi:putative transposase
MARPLRNEIPGGCYLAAPEFWVGGQPVTARGNGRGQVFRQARDQFHFLELLAKLPGRFGVVLYANVLMTNHYQEVLETPEANLIRCLQLLRGVVLGTESIADYERVVIYTLLRISNIFSYLAVKNIFVR